MGLKASKKRFPSNFRGLSRCFREETFPCLSDSLSEKKRQVVKTTISFTKIPRLGLGDIINLRVVFLQEELCFRFLERGRFFR